MSVAVLLLASGRSTRFGGANKLNLEITPGVTVLELSLRNILKSGIANQLVITASDETEARINLIINRLSIPAEIVYGGEERRDSVRNGLRACKCEYVMIHDAARPFASVELYKRVYNGIDDKRCAIPALPVTDTIYQVDETGKVFGVAHRDGIVAVQTPQGFPLETLMMLHEKEHEKGLNFTDDGSMFLHYGYEVELVEGEKNNMKITYPTDLEIARIMAIKAGILEGMRIGN
jgi:2-C-methyl-D-erythritol 4-phosphate cytidylyltransferase